LFRRSPQSWSVLGAAFAVVLSSSLARADDPAADPAPKTPTAQASSSSAASSPDGGSALPAIAAFVPGLVLHGSGHYAARQRQTFRTLLILEGASLVLLGGGLTGIALTGASRRLIAPLTALSVTGFGLFIATFLADVYGVVTPESARGAPLRARPLLTTESGVWYRYDAQFAGRALFTESADVVVADRHRLRLEMQALPGDPSLRTRGLVGERVLRSDRDNSFVDLEGAVTHLRFPVDGFYSTSFEAAVRGRLDLERIGSSLRGSFAESRIGGGLSALRTRDVGTDPDELLLVRSSVGAYLGQGRGEVELSYDHRRDTLAGGLLLPGIPAGIAGFLGARMQLFFGDWGVQTEVQAGAAILGGVSLLMRTGGGS
jgi:hypothetical protein